jgi:hypothetical protein
MSEKLKPCPFCGGTPELVTRNVEPQGDPWYGKKMETFVLCDCGACLFDGAFHEGFWDAETRAIAAWNRRSLQRDTWMRAMEVAAESCASVLDLKEEARALQASRDASGTDEELSRLQHWATVSTYNAGVRRCAAAIRALPMPEGGE